MSERDLEPSEAHSSPPPPASDAASGAAPGSGRAGRARRAAVSVLHLDTGGCGACAQSVAALLAPRHAEALRAEGISMARSPRHADIALITGGMTRAARAAALRTLDATPYPHALIAVGDCAIDGCVFRGSPLLLAEPAEALDANVEIAGCPPTPTAILAAIVEAKRLLTGEIADDATDDSANAGEESDEADENDNASVTPMDHLGDVNTTMATDVHTVDHTADDDADTDDADIADDDTAHDVDDEDETRGGRR